MLKIEFALEEWEQRTRPNSDFEVGQSTAIDTPRLHLCSDSPDQRPVRYIEIPTRFVRWLIVLACEMVVAGVVDSIDLRS